MHQSRPTHAAGAVDADNEWKRPKIKPKQTGIKDRATETGL